MTGFRRCSLIVAIVLAAVPLRAAAQNRIVNGSFDSDRTDWNLAIFDGSSVAWSPDDVDSSATSGSIRLEEDGTTGPANSVLVTQCLSPVVAGQPYDAGAEYQVPSFPGEGEASLRIDWRDGPGCGGSLVDPVSLRSPSPPAATWSRLEFVAELAPAGAQSALFALVAAFAPPTGSVAIHFDDAFFVPEPSTPAAGLAAVLAVLARSRSRGRRRLGRNGSGTSE